MHRKQLAVYHGASAGKPFIARLIEDETPDTIRLRGAYDGSERSEGLEAHLETPAL